MTTLLKHLDKESAHTLLQGVKYILMDVDGVLWSGTDVIAGVPQTLEYLHHKQGKELRFLSNNASVSREELLRNFAKRGMANRSAHEMYNSGYAAALRLQQLLGKPTPTTETTNTNESNNNNSNKNKQNESNLPLVHGNVFVIGEQGLCDEIQRVLAPGYITYGTELNDMNAIGVPYTSHLFASAWTQRILPAPYHRLVICDGNTCRMVQHKQANNKNNNKSEVHNAEDAQHQVVEEDANKLSLSDLKAVAVVAGLDLHFNILKLACASIILHGAPAVVLPSMLSHLGTHTQETTKEGTNNNSQEVETNEIKEARELYTRPLFIGTNTDPQIPVGKPTVLVPGAGSMVNAVATCAGRTPDVICGKPFVDMAKILFANEHISNPSETCLMIGDRLTTDIAFGNAAGCKTMLVLSGIEGMREIEKSKAEGNVHMLPNYIADSLAVFLPE